MKQLLNAAQALLPWSIEHRRFLHQHPELSGNEQQTAEYCRNILNNLGYTTTVLWQHGFIADLILSQDYPTIALRADMDALPIQEKNQHDYRSQNNGAAHMCGHDVHMAIALTTAKLIKEHKQWFNHNVRFIFQPSEESPPGGALGLINNGCLENVAEIYGLHNDPGTATGTIKTRHGALMAAGDLFSLQVIGKGGHAARPQDCLDPIIVVSELISHWQSIISRHINPAHPAVLSVCKISGGDTFNVIPDQAECHGTIRTFCNEDRTLIQKLMKQSLQPYQNNGYQCDLTIINGYDAVINHKECVDKLVAKATMIIDPNNIDADTEPAGWAEDFCYYLQHKKGAFYFLGSGNNKISAPLHSAHFDVEEKCLAIGAAIMASLLT